uniref:Uncharacterized protein n=1 Tax=Klebsiella phage vB_KpnM_Iguana_ER37 TaxID=3076781 RepID=A0AB38Z396_9CAUD
MSAFRQFTSTYQIGGKFLNLTGDALSTRGHYHT